MDSLIRDLMSQGGFLTLVAALLGGLLTAFTPCVLPLVPITLGTLGVTRDVPRRRALLMSSVYAAGIVLCFTALGLVFSLTGAVFGSYLASPYVLVGVAAVFVFLAVGAFELIIFRLPTRLANVIYRGGGRGGLLGAFLAGLVAGLVAVPCVGPVLFGVLTYVATAGEPLWGAALLATYAIGFSLPFVLAGVFLVRLPKSGAWMNVIKSLFGLCLLWGAFWFLRLVWPALMNPASAWVGSGLLAAGAILGALHLRFDDGWRRALRKGIGVVVMTVGGALIINVLAMAPQLDWCEQTPRRDCLAESCQANRATVIVFKADWCHYCRDMAVTLEDPRVRSRLAPYGQVRADVGVNPKLAEKLGIRGIPAIIVFDDQCREVSERFIGFGTPEEFLEFLTRLGL